MDRHINDEAVKLLIPRLGITWCHKKDNKNNMKAYNWAKLQKTSYTRFRGIQLYIYGPKRKQEKLEIKLTKLSQHLSFSSETDCSNFTCVLILTNRVQSYL